VHELGIAQSIVEAVRQEVLRHGGGRVSRVGLKVGELSGVNADALRFSFEVTVQDTELTGAELAIEEVPLRFRCTRCETDFSSVNFESVCPACGSVDTRPSGGDELQIVYLELE